MKIQFDNNKNNYIEFRKNSDKVYIILSAKDPGDLNKTVVNSVELTKEQLQQLMSDID